MNNQASRYPSHPAWFCLRTQPKHEHIAAIHLRRRIDDIEVFCPRLRLRKQTRRGAVWFVEALFPSYLFARFDPAESLQLVKSTPGISGLLTFGHWIPLISEEIIKELRADFDENQMHEVHEELRPGESVVISSGPFQGLKASIIRVLPGPQRVQILIDILGRATPVEVPMNEVLGGKSIPELLANKGVVALKAEGKKEAVSKEKGSRGGVEAGPGRGRLGVGDGQGMSR